MTDEWESNISMLGCLVKAAIFFIIWVSQARHALVQAAGPTM
jgi:hypothetical protein